MKYRFLLVFVVFILAFLQPHIYCNTRSRAAGEENNKNPIFKRPAETGFWEAPGAPDKVMAADIKLKAQAREVDDKDMLHLESADQKAGCTSFQMMPLLF